MSFSCSGICILRLAACAAILILLSVLPVDAQSSDVRFPTAVDAKEIVGVVPVRDIGDSRLTDHFYTFNGLPGDILITVESKNLNGDFDVFTAAELRPLLKVTVYAESSTAITKNIYLRKPESLILRVEARTPNDDEGNYRIRFSGSFAPVENRLLARDSATPKEETSQPRTGNRKTTRVSSSGARIDEPVVEVAAAPTPKPTPAPTTEETAAAVTKVTPPRTPRGRRTPARVTPRKPTAKLTDQASSTDSTSGEDSSKPAKEGNDASETRKSASEEGTRTETKRVPPRRSPPKPIRGPRVPKAEVTAENGRLIIEVKGGSRIEYLMSTVTRLTVENGEVVIVSDGGYTKRVPLTSILRMSIAP
jgi:hypothetical protein